MSGVCCLLAFAAMSAHAGIDRDNFSGPTVFSDGREWIAGNLEATQFDGIYRIETDLLPMGSLTGIKFDVETVLALCNVIVTYLPSTLKPTFGRFDVYRLDLNFAVPKLDGSGFEIVDDKRQTISVLEGECQPPHVRQSFFPTFGPLFADWYLRRGSRSVVGESTNVAVVFRRPSESTSEMISFPFKRACDMILADPLFSAIANPELEDALIPPSTEAMSIRVEIGVHTKLIALGSSRTAEFGIKDGVCVSDEVGAN